jgi:hypothetical protein
VESLALGVVQATKHYSAAPREPGWPRNANETHPKQLRTQEAHRHPHARRWHVGVACDWTRLSVSAFLPRPVVPLQPSWLLLPSSSAIRHPPDKHHVDTFAPPATCHRQAQSPRTMWGRESSDETHDAGAMPSRRKGIHNSKPPAARTRQRGRPQNKKRHRRLETNGFYQGETPVFHYMSLCHHLLITTRPSRN